MEGGPIIWYSPFPKGDVSPWIHKKNENITQVIFVVSFMWRVFDNYVKTSKYLFIFSLGVLMFVSYILKLFFCGYTFKTQVSLVISPLWNICISSNVLCLKVHFVDTDIVALIFLSLLIEWYMLFFSLFFPSASVFIFLYFIFKVLPINSTDLSCRFLIQLTISAFNWSD